MSDNRSLIVFEQLLLHSTYLISSDRSSHLIFKTAIVSRNAPFYGKVEK
ncbi:hypothetical protein [Crinalium epipsammum]|nr:hypothetical protein [Crinalium epipsammum]